jgi:hypothetical protein
MAYDQYVVEIDEETHATLSNKAIDRFQQLVNTPGAGPRPNGIETNLNNFSPFELKEKPLFPGRGQW